MFSELKISGRVTLVYHHESLFSVWLNRRLESHRGTCAHITDIAHTLDPANTIHTWEVMRVKANSPFGHYFENTSALMNCSRMVKTIPSIHNHV